MARVILDGTFKNADGNAISGGTVTIYLANTTTLATVYDAKSGGSAVSGSTLTTSSTGYWYCYVDPATYGANQEFKVTFTKAGYSTITYDYITVFAALPKLTTTERDALSTKVAGDAIYNTSTNKLNFYNGSAWEAVTSA